MLDWRNDDEALMALLEQTEIITECWTQDLRASQTQKTSSCLSKEEIQAYMSGALEVEQSVLMASHMGNCKYCRGNIRELNTLAAAESDVKNCILGEIREIMQKKPELGAKALVYISRRLRPMILQAPPETTMPKRIDVEILTPDGQPKGEWLSLIIERVPYINSSYKLCLDVRAVSKGLEGYRLSFLLRSKTSTIHIGDISLTQGMTRLTVDLSDLYIKPGYLSVETIGLFAEQIQDNTSRDISALLDTGPQVAPLAAETDNKENRAQTMTSELLKGKSKPKQK
jgi:hypothetical protein